MMMRRRRAVEQEEEGTPTAAANVHKCQTVVVHVARI
jgi:hypothetical protein